jgi:DNA-binding phage protein
MKQLVEKNTSNFHAHLIESLRNPTEAIAYLKVALEEFEQDGDTEFFFLALRNIAEAHGGISGLVRAHNRIWI